MTNKKDNDVVEVDGEKGEKVENVVVHVDKDGAEEIKKLTKTLSSKKGTATSYSKSKLQNSNQPSRLTTKTTLVLPKPP